MFGYLVPGALPDSERERFRGAYCGLCHVLGERYGTAARFILNYDFTFLAIFLSDTSCLSDSSVNTCADIPDCPRDTAPEPDSCTDTELTGTGLHDNIDQNDALLENTCPMHPLKRQQYLKSSPALELSADLSVILAWWQLQDHIQDQDGFSGVKYKAAAKILQPAYDKAAKIRPDFDILTRRQLRKLALLESERCASIDRAADTFAVLLSGAAEAEQNTVKKRVLRELFYHLGRWIYLIDAADDLQQDYRQGSYNAVALRYGLTDGQWTSNARREFAATLDHSIHAMTAAFELWDFGQWKLILEDTLYNRLFQVGKAVLDGRGKKRSHGNGDKSK